MAEQTYKPNYEFYGDEAEFVNPKYNPLKQFRSYSFYHVLMVSNTTDFVVELNQTKGTNTDIYMHPDLLGTGKNRFSKKTLANGTEYIVLVNTSTDSNITIDNIEFHSYLGGTVMSSEDVPAELFTDNIKMTVTEPFGARFIEHILTACQVLGVQQTQAVFAFKTIFVGHLDSTANGSGKSSGNIEVLSDYSAYDFFVSDISFTFLSSKTVYSITALPAANGLANVPTLSEIEQPTFTMDSGTLNAFFQKLETAANAPVRKKEEQQRNTNKQVSIFQYKIINADYTSAEYTISKDMQEFKKGVTPEQWTYTIPANSTVHGIISDIVANCKEIQNEAKIDKSKFDSSGVQTVYEPYIYSYVEQKKQGNIVTTILTYVIQKRKIVVFQSEEVRKKRQSITSPIISDTQSQQRFYQFLGKQLHENANLLEFDYIFTGKNNDIIKFDMVFNFGLGVFQDFVTTKMPLSIQTQTQHQDIEGGNKLAANASGVTPQIAAGRNTPAPASATAPKPITGPQKEPSEYEKFQMALRRYSQFETFSTEIEILGNPRLFQHITRKSNFETGTTASARDDYVRGAPVYAKINVFMPFIDEETGLVDFKKTPEKGFRNPFWYDGIFSIREVTSFFVNGTFKQKLILMQAPTEETSVQQYRIESGGEETGTGKSAEERKGGEAHDAAGKQKNTTVSKCKTKSEFPVPDGTDGGTNSINVKAFLKTIRVCEGTYPSEFGSLDDNGYRRIVNGYPVPDDSTYAKYYKYNEEAVDNSRVVEKQGSDKRRYFKDYTSSPYQGHPRFYVHLKDHRGIIGKFVRYETPTSAAGAYQFVYDTWKNLGFNSMTKENQDKAAVKLIQRRKVLDLIKQGKIKEALPTLQYEWASLGPRYGQGYICEDNIIKIFEANGGKLNETQ